MDETAASKVELGVFWDFRVLEFVVYDCTSRIKPCLPRMYNIFPKYRAGYMFKWLNYPFTASCTCRFINTPSESTAPLVLSKILPSREEERLSLGLFSYKSTSAKFSVSNKWRRWPKMYISFLYFTNTYFSWPIHSQSL